MRLLSLGVFVALVACGQEHSHEPTHNDHNHTSKYGGQLIELGAHEFQVDMLLYPESGALEAYLFDGHAERAVPSTMKSITVRVNVGEEQASIELKPAANPYSKDKAGEASKFRGQSDLLKNVEHFEGVLVEVAVAGKSFKDVAFHYHPGSGHDHDHEH
ncbi:MAG: hypothetical protein ACYTEG_13940 [Planctomycetota bacterium]|jgi:hypothetical protein